ncbi:hypothetical protein CYMTET_27819, partial [Cymbomonas tetramitiformis]
MRRHWQGLGEDAPAGELQSRASLFWSLRVPQAQIREESAACDDRDVEWRCLPCSVFSDEEAAEDVPEAAAADGEGPEAEPWDHLTTEGPGEGFVPRVYHPDMTYQPGDLVGKQDMRICSPQPPLWKEAEPWEPTEEDPLTSFVMTEKEAANVHPDAIVRCPTAALQARARSLVTPHKRACACPLVYVAPSPKVMIQRRRSSQAGCTSEASISCPLPAPAWTLVWTGQMELHAEEEIMLDAKYRQYVASIPYAFNKMGKERIKRLHEIERAKKDKERKQKEKDAQAAKGKSAYASKTRRKSLSKKEFEVRTDLTLLMQIAATNLEPDPVANPFDDPGGHQAPTPRVYDAHPNFTDLDYKSTWDDLKESTRMLPTTVLHQPVIRAQPEVPDINPGVLATRAQQLQRPRSASNKRNAMQ